MELTDGSTEIEATIDTPVSCHLPAGILDPLHLNVILRFVICRHLHSLSVSADHAPIYRD